MHLTAPTIRFTAELAPSGLTLPKDAAAQLANKGAIAVEGIVNTFPFSGAIERNGLAMPKALQVAVDARPGDEVNVEITRLEGEAEVRVPADFNAALQAAPTAKSAWEGITPLARRDWILWITTARQAKTRDGRIQKACSMLSDGKRRVCCFGGLNWLTKDHPKAPTWAPLP